MTEEVYTRLLPLLQWAKTARPKGRAGIIALDGRSASGKTTLAAALGEALGAGVVHMDDFFLPPSLRTPARLAQPGGNVHYERFSGEVLPLLASGEAFSYRRFDCKTMSLGKLCTIAAGPWRIVEGAYSCHPAFGDYADLRVFCTADPALQSARILERNGSAGAKAFADRWIPLEEAYFARYQVQESAALVL
ncbi:MAG: uridine kinase [Pseudoflavonifractor sp.]